MNLNKLKKGYFLIVQFLFSLLSFESFGEFLNDNGGGFVLPISGKAYNDEDFLEYQRLEVNLAIESILPEDLPSDFCDEACGLVDEFRRKTVNESVEWMLYFDYKTGEVIYCWKGREGRSGGDYERINLYGRNIASIHSHPRGYYSFPSPENFDMLENEFEDYEVITSVGAMWIVEFKGFVEKSVRNNFQYILGEDINDVVNIIKSKYDDDKVDIIVENVISNYLLRMLDKNIVDIELILIKKEYD